MRRCGFAIVLALAACNDASDEPPASAPFIPSRPSPPRPQPPAVDAGVILPGATVSAIAVNRDESCATVSTQYLSVCWRGATPPPSKADLILLSISFDEAVGNGDWFLGRNSRSTFVWGSGALGANGLPDASAAGTKILYGTGEDTAYPSKRAAAGSRHGCATGHSRQLFCWGDDTYCQVSAGDTCTQQTRGMTDLSSILGPDTYFESVAAGAGHTCGVASRGTGATATVYCWGANTNGETGQPVSGTTPPMALPLVPPSTTDAVIIASGDHHACAAVMGDLYCWGKNDKQQASPLDPSLVVAPSRIDLSDIVGKVSQLALGGDRTCFVVSALNQKQPSRAFCSSGGKIREVPAIEDILHLAVSDTHACAIARPRRSKSNATALYCWSGDEAPQRVTAFDPR